MSDHDVIVIGAGAAGLAAGETLAQAGVSFAVLEAKARVGGRAWTDERIFPGIPFDRGCHWMHSASRNPFREIADRLGVAYRRMGTRRSSGLYLAGEKADPATTVAAWDAVEAAFAAADDTGAAGRDVDAQSVCDPNSPWWPLARHWMSLLSALPPDKISTLDLAAYADTKENWPVASGYGALVARASAHVPVHLGVEVRAIDRSSSPIRIETSHGTLRANSVIVTVSTNILSSGAIRFTPALPDDVMQAAANCPTGVAEKVAFLLDEPLQDFDDTAYIDTFDPADRERAPINFVINHVSNPVIIGQLCGETARTLEAEGEAAMADFGLAALKDVFGNGIAARVRRTTATHWTSDPHVLGAYSCALPGHAGARALLRAPIEGGVFLAGEAVSPTAFSTAHGARQSGFEAVRAALSAAW
ncbi:NAD(P)/FAD-dependent oxidoreductase [Stappia sp. ES.058]|uniref:flavin monoamine oxidase family protein n=1 Tax=Stappia sp. ES.058 TaxID=1881061 RepID=UPI00087DAC89|nr:NAD(P)/FAD-dependent oxidoreductase [Stappia sp. ES.058]SDU26121.1 monoamine oxidase [Stappia sp. ES.058]